jgi:hypothetical protein
MSSTPATSTAARATWVGAVVARLGRVLFSAATSPVLTIVAVALVATSLVDAQLELDGYGLASSLPPAYYAGLVLLPLASALEWSRRDRRSFVVVAQIVAFVLVVWLTPLILEGTPRFRTGYVIYGFVDPLVRGEGILPGSFVYHNWPLFSILLGGIVNVFDLSALAVMKAFPTVIVLLYLVPLAFVLRLGERRSYRPVAGAWVAGSWLFVVFDWTGQDYFSPQALAFLFFLCLLALLGHVAVRCDGVFNATATVGTLGLFSVIVATHVLTGLITLFVMTALTLTRMLRRPGLVLACALIFVAWQAFVANAFFSDYGDRLLESLYSAGDFLQTNVSGRVTGSHEHIATGQVRMVMTVVAFGLAGVALFTLWRARRFPREARFALVALLAIGVATPISVYGGEMVIRALLFSLPLIGMLVVAAWRSRALRVAVACALAIGAPLHVVSHYGNEAYDYVSPAEIQGYQFIADHLAPAKIYGAFPGGAFMRTTELEWRNGAEPSGEPPTLASYRHPDRLNWSTKPWPIYVAVGRGDDAAARVFYDRPGLFPRVRRMLARDSQFTLAYRNSDVSIYRWRDG